MDLSVSRLTTNTMGKLSVVATPIGNLEDITLRAIRTLKEADAILCEDTRMTKRLLSHYEITTPTISFHTHTTDGKTSNIVEQLKEGKHFALVTDAGTPGISDPGSVLVGMVRAEGEGKVTIETIPGPSALTAALSISGMPTSDFLFMGFLPHKKGRETAFKEISDSDRCVVFYESTHRIIKALESLEKHFAETEQSDRKIAVTRELTKMFEEVQVGSAGELLAYFKADEVKTKGEFVCIVWPK